MRWSSLSGKGGVSMEQNGHGLFALSVAPAQQMVVNRIMCEIYKSPLSPSLSLSFPLS